MAEKSKDLAWPPKGHQWFCAALQIHQLFFKEFKLRKRRSWSQGQLKHPQLQVRATKCSLVCIVRFPAGLVESLGSQNVCAWKWNIYLHPLFINWNTCVNQPSHIHRVSM